MVQVALLGIFYRDSRPEPTDHSRNGFHSESPRLKVFTEKFTNEKPVKTVKTFQRHSLHSETGPSNWASCSDAGVELRACQFLAKFGSSSRILAGFFLLEETKFFIQTLN